MSTRAPGSSSRERAGSTAPPFRDPSPRTRRPTRPGVLRPDTRATAWVCSDPKTPPLIDWNGAAE